MLDGPTFGVATVAFPPAFWRLVFSAILTQAVLWLTECPKLVQRHIAW